MSGWTALAHPEKEESPPPPTTDAGRGKARGVVHAYLTEDESKLYLEAMNLKKQGKGDMITKDQADAMRTYSRIYKQIPERREKDKTRLRESRVKATQMRAFLGKKLDIGIVSRETGKGGKAHQSPDTVYRAAQKQGYTQDLGTLMRRSDRYAENPKEYQDSDSGGEGK